MSSSQWWVTSLSKAAQPPSRHWKLNCQASARSKIFASSACSFGRTEPQRHQHHRGVVGVRIIRRCCIRRPSRSLRVRIVDRPIAADAHLLVDQPLRRFLQRRVLRREAGLGQRDDINRRIPDRRKAGLNAKILRVIDEKTAEIRERLLIKRMRLLDNRARARR